MREAPLPNLLINGQIPGVDFVFTGVLIQELFQAIAVKIQSDFVSINQSAIRRNYGHVLGNGIDELAKLLFSLPSILDIGSRRVPTDDFPLLVPKRVVAY